MKSEWVRMVYKKIMVIGVISSVLMASGCKDSEVLPVAEASTATVELRDISNHWAKDSVLKALENGYVDGYEDSTFRPDQNVSRAEFMKMLAVATKQQVATASQGSAWYAPYVDYVFNSGIYHAEDFPSDQFDHNLTRIEMAKLAVRFLDEKSRPKEAHLYDTSAMYKAVSLGVINGLTGGELAPNEATTRAQSVVIIERILSAKSGKKLPVDKLALGNADLELTGSNTRVYANTPTLPLPIKYAFNDNIDVTIHKIRMTDLANKEDPLARKIIDYDSKSSHPLSNYDDLLVVSLYFSIDNKVSDPITRSINMYNTLMPIIGKGPIGEGTTVYTLNTSKVGKTEGWIMYTENKKRNAKFLDGTEPYPLKIFLPGRDIPLTDTKQDAVST
ncbi:S-layer homology domain-containing protein [Paenibacillus chartarius]|uniref:S-layer homology domain-containing protein n=1 Tax=Paenibacillus chartarius TaxID=747481 RepID=A0ABV6DI15_9BACL